MQKEIEDLKNKFFKLAEDINAPAKWVKFYEKPIDYACSYVEYVDGVFFYIGQNERGGEVLRRTTNDLNVILYWLMKNLTWTMASEYELKHRIENQDSRRMLFEHQIELLQRINENWAQELREEYRKVLQKHPYDDFALVRAKFTKELRDQGHLPEVAWKMARERYPEPISD